MSRDSEGYRNDFDQAIGQPLGTWVAPAAVNIAPLTKQLQGQYCELEPLTEDHLVELQTAFRDAPDELWTYLAYGPMKHEADYLNWISTLTQDPSNTFAYLIRDTKQRALGVAAYLRIAPQAGSIEIGHLCFSPQLQQSKAATEALYLMIEAVFLLGYRRCEWKCNDLNEPSMRAAKRLGFRYEGTFRNAQVVKGANRDTAWFSIIDSEWPERQTCFEKWLEPSNFDAHGKQIQALSSMIKSLS
jgi:RimJ/RimL family protein N-acetyltransferase